MVHVPMELAQDVALDQDPDTDLLGTLTAANADVEPFRFHNTSSSLSGILRLLRHEPVFAAPFSTEDRRFIVNQYLTGFALH